MRLLRFLCAVWLLTQPLLAEPTPQEKHAAWVRAHYTKFEHQVPMRDGVKLFTTVYYPNWSQQDYPIVIMRTPYSAGPYGANKYRKLLGPNEAFDKEGFIFVFQDVRGRFMSEGQFLNMRPQANAVNESTDAYDTIEWATKNLTNNNGRVGQWGISYPGFYTAAAMISSHPALKVASPQAPIADWYWDDMHHNGAFSLQLAFNFFSIFGPKREEPTGKWPERFQHKTPDGYQFFLDLGPLSNVNKRHFEGKIDFWNKLSEHPNYDSFWQSRNLLPHLNNVHCAVLTVGGWFDAEDLYGPLKIYQSVEKKNPQSENLLVMGPWFHGGWFRGNGTRLGDTPFDFPTSLYFQEHVMLPYFLHHLKAGADPQLPEALVFETGANRWRRFDTWPPEGQPKTIYFASKGSLTFSPPNGKGQDAFVSDPAHPVPSTAAISIKRRREMMTEDQRYASRRPDVLSYQTEALKEDLTLAGPMKAELFVSTDQTAADWVVKLIDVYPGEEPPVVIDDEKIGLGHAQLLVRSEILRGRYRESFSQPKPFKPGKVTRVSIELSDVCHTFQRGHRLMIQVQSSHFPFFDRNPQNYVENIFEARESDFVKATHKLWRGPANPSSLQVNVLETP